MTENEPSSFPGPAEPVQISAYGQGLDLPYTPAVWSYRFSGGLVDGIILLPFSLGAAAVGGRLVEFLVSLLGTAVLAYVEGRTGWSPGKKVVGMRVVREVDGQLLGFGRALARRLLHILDGLSCFVGYLWPLWDKKRQTFADKAASAVVIKL